MPSLFERKRVDLAGELRRLVSDDALDRLEPVLDRAELGPKLRILIRKQLDSLSGFAVGLGIDRLAPRTVERIAVLNPQPSVEDPAADTDRGDRGGPRQNLDDQRELF